MSDDDDYYDEDYDGDWLWLEDGNLDIADDLVETAIYSPVPIDDPCLDVIESFSDWEYYSDDYYDDDPTILRRQRRGESTLKGAGHINAQNDGLPRRKKQMLFPTDSIPMLSLGAPVTDSIAATFKGVVWKRPSDPEIKPALYEPGDGEAVALLKNWRENFKPSYHKLDHLRLDKQQKYPKSGHNTRRLARKSGSSDNGEGYDDEHLDNPQLDPLNLDSRMTFSPPPLNISEWEMPLEESTVGRRQSNKNASQLREITTVRDTTPEEVASVPSPEKEGPTIKQSAPVQVDEHREIPYVEIPYVEVPSVLNPPSPRSKRRRRSSNPVDIVEEESLSNTAAEEQTLRRSKRVASKKLGVDEVESQVSTVSNQKSKRREKGRK